MRMSVELLILGMHVGLLTELVHVRVLPIVLARAPKPTDRQQDRKVQHVPEGVEDPKP